LKKLQDCNCWKRNSKRVAKISSESLQSDHFYYHFGNHLFNEQLQY
jgi:hypothetical protein